MTTTAFKHRELEHRMPPALPEKIEEWQRFLKSERTLNDLVEDIHRVLVNDEELGPQYRALLRAVYDTQAVEGSLSADDTLAAIMIRDKAKTLDEANEVAKEKAANISRALRIVMARYRSSRKQRRDMLQGQIVPSDESNAGNGS